MMKRPIQGAPAVIKSDFGIYSVLDGWPAVDRDHYAAVVTEAFVRPTALVEPNRATLARLQRGR